MEVARVSVGQDGSGAGRSYYRLACAVAFAEEGANLATGDIEPEPDGRPAAGGDSEDESAGGMKARHAPSAEISGSGARALYVVFGRFANARGPGKCQD